MKPNKFYSQFVGMLPQDEEFCIPNNVEPIKSTDEKEKVFDLIYAPDPITGLPQNALGVFLSENTSPVVRQFIEANMKMSESNPPLPEGVSEKDVEFCVRHRNESLTDYVHRMNQFTRNIRSDIQNKISDVKSKVKVANKDVSEPSK